MGFGFVQTIHMEQQIAHIEFGFGLRQGHRVDRADIDLKTVSRCHFEGRPRVSLQDVIPDFIFKRAVAGLESLRKTVLNGFAF